MDAAGSAVAEQLMRRFPAARAITAVCGGGANGGDGRIAAQRLRDAGRRVRVVDVKAAPDEHDLGSPDVVLDALFGTGFHGTPRAEAAELIDAMNGLGVRIVAVDVPSGVDASTGEIGGAAVRATLTVTFHAPKVGLHVAPGRFHAGDMIVVDIGLEHLATEHALVREEILAAVPARSVADTKYTAGSVLVVGGSPGLTGAPSLAAEAAFRADAGYVLVAAPASTLPVLEVRLLEAVKRPLPEDDEGRLTADAAEMVEELAQRARAVAVGPGLGRSDGTRALVRALLERLELPIVVDADGLFGLDPVERFRCAVLLKGADTLVAGAEGPTLVVALGTPALATAGTGDVLTGVAAAFLAKGLEPRLAAAAAAVAQQRAASRAPEQRGLVASDVVRLLPRVLGSVQPS